MFPAYDGFVDPSRESSLRTSACTARMGSVGAGIVYQELEDTQDLAWVRGPYSHTLRSLRLGGGIDFVGSLLPDSDRFRWGLGGNVKWFEEATRAPWVPAGTQGSAYDADFGMVVSYRRRDLTPGSSPGSPPEEVAVRAGIVLLNAFDHAIDVPESASHPLGRAWRAGLAAEIAGGTWTAHGPKVRVLLAMDWLNYFGRVRDDHATFNLGGELWLSSLVALRFGGRDAYYSGSAGGSFGAGVSSGNRLGRLGLQLDYANIPGTGRHQHVDATVHWSL